MPEFASTMVIAKINRGMYKGRAGLPLHLVELLAGTVDFWDRAMVGILLLIFPLDHSMVVSFDEVRREPIHPVVDCNEHADALKRNQYSAAATDY